MPGDVTFTPEQVKKLFAKHAGKIAIKSGIISFLAGFIFAYMINYSYVKLGILQLQKTLLLFLKTFSNQVISNIVTEL